MNIIEIFSQFPTQESCVNHLEKIRWNNKPVCPYCKSDKSSKFKNTRYYNCLNCNNSYSVTVGTIFHDTKMDLQKWFFAIALILNAKKGISALQLQRDLGIGSYKTAWRMLQLIRSAMIDQSTSSYFSHILEMDETYIGGKPRKIFGEEQPKNKRGRGTNKTPVVGIIDRENKRVFARIATVDENGRKLTGKQLLAILQEVCLNPETTVITDELPSYRIFKQLYKHQRIDHQKAFAIGDTHTNSIESFWALLKRGIVGVYHTISVKHMQKYLNEFSFRYNNREGMPAFNLVLKQSLSL